MKTSVFIGKFRSRFLWINIAAMAAVTLLVLLCVIFGLGFYTHHGEKIIVPDLRNHSVTDAEHVLKGLGLTVVASDTGYVKTLPPGTILEQTPASGSAVKSERVIYVTINALDTPMLTLPDIIDNSSLREAQAKLTSMGFRLGEPEFIKGEKDWVYGVKCKGAALSSGDRVSVDDKLIIVAGNGLRDSYDPDLYFTDPEYEFPEVGDINPGDADDFEIVQ